VPDVASPPRAHRPQASSRPVMRLPAEVSLFLVSAAVAVGFDRLFLDNSYLLPVLALTAASHALAAFLRWRGVPVAAAALVSAVALVVVGTWVFYLSTTRFGLPNSTTLDSFRADLDEAVTRFREDKAPTEAVTGFVATTAAGFWLVAFLADWSAFRLWAPFEATIPAGSLFVFASLLGADEGRVVATGLFFLACVGFLLLHRIARQETSPSWVRGDGRRGARSLLGVGAAIAGIAVIAGAVVGPVLPGAKADAVFDVKDIGNSGGTRITVSPLVDIRQRLVDQRDTEVFTVHSPRRSYWRLTALDEFDGRVWRSSKRFEKAQGSLSSARTQADTESVRQEFQISNLSQIWLPAAYLPQNIGSTDREVRWEPTTSTLIVDKATSNDLRYTVVSAVPQLTADELREAVELPPAEISTQFMQLPDDFSDEAATLARDIIAGQATPFDKAMALERHFRDNFSYSTEVTGGHGIDRIDDFLFAETKAGYCEQFAGSFAALARAVGLPARVAVGFTPGDPDPTVPDLYHVKGRHAHAWPEVYLNGYGWVLFEPTPSRGAPNAPYTDTVEQQDSEVAPGGVLLPSTTTTTAPGSASTVPGGEPGIPFDELGGTSGGTGTTLGPEQQRGRAGMWLLVGLLVAFACYLLALPGGRRVAAMRRRRAARANGQKVELAWRDATSAVHLVGLTPRREDTPNEFAVRAGSRSMRPDALRELALLTTASRYSGLEASEAEVERARELADEIVAAVREQSTAGQRVLDELDPRPALRRARQALKRRSSTDGDTGERPRPLTGSSARR
jgi:transglutaminase-like putative cysteine protease